MADVEDYSTTAASNTTDFPEGQAPSTVNNGMRETQADIASMYQRDNAIITAGGTADVITATFTPAHTADVAGRIVVVQAASDNTSTTPTFQLDSLTARTITKNGGDALVAGDIQANGFIHLKYDLTNTRWELLNPSYATLKADSVITTSILDANVTSAKLAADVGAWVEIAQVEAGSATSVTLDGMSSAYHSYIVIASDVERSGSSEELLMQVRIGSVTQTGTSYVVNGAAATTSISMMTLSSVTEESSQFNLLIANPSNTVKYKAIQFSGLQGTDCTLIDKVARYEGSTGAVNGLYFFPTAGPFQGGLFTLYGINT